MQEPIALCPTPTAHLGEGPRTQFHIQNMEHPENTSCPRSLGKAGEKQKTKAQTPPASARNTVTPKQQGLVCCGPVPPQLRMRMEKCYLFKVRDLSSARRRGHSKLAALTHPVLGILLREQERGSHCFEARGSAIPGVSWDSSCSHTLMAAQQEHSTAVSFATLRPVPCSAAGSERQG